MINNQVPNLFLVGAPKAGTSALVNAIGQHPNIFTPRVKEPRFFDARVFYDHESDYPIKDINEYLSLYSSEESKNAIYRVDGSVFNMYSSDAIQDILKLSPDAKFIVVLRDPIQASKSMFSQRLKYTQPGFREVSDDFDECWGLIAARKNGKGYPKGCRNQFLFRYDLLYSYEKYLPFLFSEISKEKLYVAKYNDMVSNVDNFYNELFGFLGLSSNVNIVSKRVNPSYHVKSNFVKKIIGTIAFKTQRIRKRVGFTGDKFSNLKKVAEGKPVLVPSISTDSDHKMKEEFRKTYSYLKEKNIIL